MLLLREGEGYSKGGGDREGKGRKGRERERGERGGRKGKAAWEEGGGVEGMNREGWEGRKGGETRHTNPSLLPAPLPT